jgi:hypothetical protein
MSSGSCEAPYPVTLSGSAPTWERRARSVYHPGYYGAFVLGPEGHNVEVVNHNG